MPAKGMSAVRSKLTETFDKITGPMTEECVTTILIIGGGYADVLTPMALGTLVNSRLRRVERKGDGWRGTYGYTAAYSAAVHEKPGTLKGTNTPRSPASLGNVWDGSGGANSAEPHFLTKGFERDGLAEIKEAIQREMQL
jgi:hypothetical protein